MKEIERKVAELAEPIAAEAGAEVLLVEFTGSGNHWVLRIYLDKPEGVTLDDCDRVSRELGPALDVEDWIDHAYALEVSSPGLDRPLVRPADYRRFRGQVAKVHTTRSVGGARNFKGRIVACTEGEGPGEVTLESEDGREHRIPFAEIERGRLVPEF